VGTIAVYVDNAFIPFGRMKMSHMMADDLDELHAMARKLGLRREWFQDKSIPHYDVSMSVRRRAIELGAIPEDWLSDNMEAFRREARRKAALKRKKRRKKPKPGRAR
jgi:hypothetical protein